MTATAVTRRSNTTSTAATVTSRRRRRARSSGDRLASTGLCAPERARQERQLGAVFAGFRPCRGEPDASRRVAAVVTELPVQRGAEPIGVRAAQVARRPGVGVVEGAEPHDAA
jgi:hypothetical protein